MAASAGLLAVLRGAPQARLAPQDEVRIFRHEHIQKKPPASSENRRFVENMRRYPWPRHGADDRRLRLVYARAVVALQAGDLVLHMQLAALQFRDRRVVDRGVRQ